MPPLLYMAQALVLSLLPLHFFFQLLYYTDVASIACVLAAHLVSSFFHGLSWLRFLRILLASSVFQ